MYLILFCLVFSIFNSAFGDDKPKWCVTSNAAKLKCDKVATGLSNKLSCILGNDEKDCYQKIASKEADIGVFDGGMIYHGGIEHDLRAIMAEKFSNMTQTATAYFAVAVVKKSATFTINDLKGKKSCHTGVQKTSGWKIPVGTLLSKGLMKWVDCNEYATVANFFSGSCAPGAKDKKYNPDMRNSTQLCSQCSGADDKNCARNSAEPYYDYGGALKCLRDGKGDVAFVKASTVLSASDAANYQLLCLDGTKKDPKDYVTCNLARVSSHAVLTRKDASITKYQNVLKEADQKFGEKSSGSLKLYDDGSLFSKNTIGLSVVASANQPYYKYLDASYIKDVAVLSRCAKWCVTKNAMSACKNVANRAGHLTCVLGSGEEDCYKKIADKTADIGMFDGGAIYHAGKKHNLKAIMSENLKTGAGSGTSYYAVAVVKKGSPLTIGTLKGKKSCHTGVQKTSGWIVPVGHLLRKKLMEWSTDCSQYASVASFFSASCAPGANSPSYNSKKAGADKLCSLCSGSGSDKCSRSDKEPYYGYEGAFKCLKDGKGDVAFIKQSTVLANASGFELLCQDNTKKDPKYYAACYLARVPSHAMLTRSDAPIQQYQGIFQNAMAKLGADLYKPEGVLFSKNIMILANVTVAKQNYEQYLDKAYMDDIAELDGCKAVSGANGSHLQVAILALVWCIFKLLV